MGSLDFDATNVEPSAPLDVVPAGKYPCRISQTEIKETKSGTGRYLQLTLDLIEGPFKGTSCSTGSISGTATPRPRRSPSKTLSAICHAVGVLKVRNHEEFRNKVVQVKVTTRNDPQYGESNEVKGYEAIEASKPTTNLWGSTSESAAPAASTWFSYPGPSVDTSRAVQQPPATPSATLEGNYHERRPVRFYFSLGHVPWRSSTRVDTGAVGCFPKLVETAPGRKTV